MIERGKTSDLIMCKDCDWTYDGLANPGTRVTEACKNHVKRKGHTVLREITQFVHYRP